MVGITFMVFITFMGDTDLRRHPPREMLNSGKQCSGKGGNPIQASSEHDQLWQAWDRIAAW